jgi:regulatory protein
MAEVGLVDDAAYAREYVRVRHESRGLSRRALALELSRRGVGDAEADEALASLSPGDERAAARALVEHKWRSVQGLEPAAARRRLIGLLARRGYSAGMAFAVVREVEAERGGAGTASDDLGAADLI